MGVGESTIGRREIFYQRYICISIYFNPALYEGENAPSPPLVCATDNKRTFSCKD